MTGGSRGIGREVARRFAREGAKRVAIGYLRNDTAAEETAEELRELGAEPMLVRGNVASSRVARGGRRARPARRRRPLRGDGRDPARARDHGQALRLDAGRERARLPLARARGGAADAFGIVDRRLSSLGSNRVLENYVLVGTSKAALEALVRYLAVELAPLGIRVNAVSGGVVETGALDHFPNREQMLVLEPRADARRTPRRAGGRRRRRPLPLLAGGRDDPRPDARRRRRVLAGRLTMWPTEQNRAAWEGRYGARRRAGAGPPRCSARAACPT